MKKFVLVAIAALTLGAASASAATYQQPGSMAQPNTGYNVFAGSVGGDGGGN
jgi:hypothetical protein